MQIRKHLAQLSCRLRTRQVTYVSVRRFRIDVRVCV